MLTVYVKPTEISFLRIWRPLKTTSQALGHPGVLGAPARLGSLLSHCWRLHVTGTLSPARSLRWEGAGMPWALRGCGSGPTQEALPRTRSGDSVTLGRLEMPPRGVRSTSRDQHRYWYRAHLWIQALEVGSGRTWALLALGHRGFPHTSIAEGKHRLVPASQPCHHARSAHAYLPQDRRVSQQNTHACEGAPLSGDPPPGP